MKCRRVLLSFIIYSLSLLVASAQSKKTDSLKAILKTGKEDTNKVNTLTRLGYVYLAAHNNQAADSLAVKAKQLSETLHFEQGTAAAYNLSGQIRFNENKFQEALGFYKQALEIGEALQSDYLTGLAYAKMGLTYESMANYPDALKYFTAAVKIDEKTGNKKELANAYNNIGNTYADKADFSEAMKNYTTSLDLRKEINDKYDIKDSYNNIGTVYTDEGNYPEGLKYILLSLKMAEDLGDKEAMADAYGNIGIIYHVQGNYADAIKSQLQAVKLSEEIGNKGQVGNDYCNMGIAYLDMHNFQEALNSQQKALSIFKETNDLSAMSTAYGNIGVVYGAEGNYTDALENQFQSLKIAEQTGEKYAICNSFISIGQMYTLEKKLGLAKKYLDSALMVAKETKKTDNIEEIYSSYAQMDSAAGDYKSAYNNYKLFIVYLDSLRNEENTKKLVSEQMQYDFDKKQSEEKAAQDKKDAVHNEEVKKQNIVIYSVSGGLLLVLLLAGTIFRSLQQNRKKTQIIVAQKAEVEEKNVLIAHQKHLVEEKNKDILDSITYAKRLQDAILPPLSIIAKYLPESFVLYKPKDIVAGDFYWMERAGEVVLIAACDCTGHGVPGAMVSVVCSNALNRTVKEFKITEPGKILDKVRELVIETFSHRDPFGEKSESNVQDGMDISLCCINTQTKGIQWSGANNPLWYIQNGELKEIVADKQPIGKFDGQKPFSTQNLNLNKGDTLYLFTDGYADQFGGPKGKKYKYKQFSDKLKVISDKPMNEQKRLLDEEFESWKGALEQVDDVLIMGIRV